VKIGYVGLGKLGCPCAVALDAAGHEVIGYDVSPEPARYLEERKVPYLEEGLADLLVDHTVTVAPSIDALVAAGPEVIFVAVQTPHAPDYDGTKPAPAERRDFEYGYLVAAVRAVATATLRHGHEVTIVIVSTVLPGTFNAHLRALANPFATLTYSPAFIAMGTTVADFTNPEFVLVGADDPIHAEPLAEVFGKVHDRPLRVVSITSAELTKVAYNVYLSAKIAFANYVGEIAHKVGADADEVTGSLALATDRIVSPRYMAAGMGDGGGCHPRDLIALSSLAERHSLSFDLADALMSAREAHSGWLAGEVASWSALTGLPVVVLGKAYKPETNLVLGSPAALLMHQIKAMGVKRVGQYDPHMGSGSAEVFKAWTSDPAIYFVATKHARFLDAEFPPGSVVLDPFGFMPDRLGVTLVRIGRKGMAA
jgi:UDPglucose 6-dehydrogenase